jgi:Zn ribbon nucleic-acid-binding protein
MAWVLWRFFGKDFCPNCQRVTRWKWWRNPEIQPNDPPLFAQWVCLKCGEGTGIKATPGVIEALRTLEWLDDMTE